MAARFDTTRAEVRRAYLHLKEQGYIYSQQGYGSFFSGKKEKIRLILNDSQNFTEKMDALKKSTTAQKMSVLSESKTI